MSKVRGGFIFSIVVFWGLLIAAIGILIYAAVSGNYVLLLIPGVFFVFIFYLTVVTRRDAAFVPTPEPVIHKMLEMAELKPDELVYDLGSGDGRILEIAARDFGAKAIGVEMDRALISVSSRRLKSANLEKETKILHGNFYQIDISDADVVTLYLRQDTNDKLGMKFKKELKPGARIVSYTFIMTGWEPTKVNNAARIYMYSM